MVKYGHWIATLVFLGRFTTFQGWVGGWVGEIENNVHFIPAEAEIWAQVGRINDIQNVVQ